MKGLLLLFLFSMGSISTTDSISGPNAKIIGVWVLSDGTKGEKIEMLADGTFRYSFALDDTKAESIMIKGDYYHSADELIFRFSNGSTQVNFINKLTEDSLILIYKKDTTVWLRND